MGIFDWLRAPPDQEQTESDLSRRAFFARLAGRALPDEEQAEGTEATRAAEEEAGPAGDASLTFFVAGFPFHDGPVLVPMLRPELEFELRPDPHHFSDPHAVRIQWGKDHLGYVPPELSARIRELLAAGVELRCRAVRVDPSAELSRVLEVEVAPIEEGGEAPDASGSEPPGTPPE